MIKLLVGNKSPVTSVQASTFKFSRPRLFTEVNDETESPPSSIPLNLRRRLLSIRIQPLHDIFGNYEKKNPDLDRRITISITENRRIYHGQI